LITNTSFLDALNFPNKEHLRQHTDDGDCRHVDKRRGEVDVGEEEADDDRGGDRREVADEIGHPSGQAQQPLRCQRRNQRPGDRGEAVPEECDRHEHDDPRGRVRVVGAEHEHCHRQTDDDRQLPGGAQ